MDERDSSELAAVIAGSGVAGAVEMVTEGDFSFCATLFFSPIEETSLLGYSTPMMFASLVPSELSCMATEWHEEHEVALFECAARFVGKAEREGEAE